MSDTSMAQYTDLYVETAKGYLATLNSELLQLEKSPDDHEVIENIFRAAHSLKGQSAAMGFEQTGYLCHVVEDAFYEIKEKQLKADPELADLLFKAFDNLSDSVSHVESYGTEKPVADVAEELKKLTGVQTVGSGHSDRSIESAVAAAVAPDPQPEPVTTTPAEEPVYEALDGDNSLTIEPIRTVPVKVEQLDEMVGSLEELMVNRLTIRALVRKVNDPELTRIQDKSDELVDYIQFQVMKLRAVPLSIIFEHYPRAMRDLGRKLGKTIELRIEGGDLAIDRTIVERLDDPMTHLLRNAADHGIGKEGIISIEAHEEQDSAVISVSDNGMGIDWQAVAAKAHVDPNNEAALKNALFSGISTSEQVTLVSGRGIGLDAVRNTVEDIGGTVEVASRTGKGATFRMKLPLTVSVVSTLIVQVGAQRYAIAATVIDRSLQLKTKDIVRNVGQEVFRYKEKDVPLIRLHDAFGTSAPATTDDFVYVVIISIDGEPVALAVDTIIETLETVIRPLPKLLKGSRLFSSVAVVGDGSSALLLNPRGFVHEE